LTKEVLEGRFFFDNLGAYNVIVVED